MNLRGLVMAWVRKHCPGSDVQEDICQHLERALQRDATCSFTIGRDLTRSEMPFLVCCFSGEFFAFELTMEQAGRLQVRDNMLVCSEGPPQQDRLLSYEPAVWLENIAIDNAKSLDRSRPITGTLRYRTDRVLLDPSAIRVVCEPPGRGRICLFHYLFQLTPPEGAVMFSLPPLGDLLGQDGTAFKGALPLFFQIWTTAEHDSLSTAYFAPSVVSGPPKSPWLQPASHTDWQPMVPMSPWAIQPTTPASSCYPPPYDPWPHTAPPTGQEIPVSDIRAVLGEIS